MSKREEALRGLRRAKRILLQRGWTQGSYYDLDGRDAYCVVGAYLYAMDLEGIVEGDETGGDLEEIYIRLENANYITEAFGDEPEIEDDMGRVYDGPVEFNDQPGRTRDEVLAYLDTRIASLEGANG